MGLRVLRFEATPNPNALKVIVEPPPAGGIRSYFRAAQAEGDTLGEALFSIKGITNVLIHEHFVSINKQDALAWGPIKKAAKAVLERND